MIFKSKRNAFSLLTALFVIVLMATVAMLVMNMTGKMVKETTTQYQREQAALLAKSYTEYAIMAVTANDRTTNCLSDIDGTVGSNPAIGNGYRIRARIAYIGHNAEVGACPATRVFSSSVNEDNSPLNIIVDVYVEYKEADNTGGPWITYHKRTLQKI